MNKAIMAVIVCAVLLTGCDYFEGVKKVEGAITTIEQAEKTAAPLLAMLQDEIPGWEGFDAEKKLELINKFNNVEQKGEALQGFIVSVVKSGLLPSKVAEVATGIGDAIGIGTGALGLVTTLLAMLKNRQTKKVAIAAMKAGELSKNGYGSQIATTSAAAGVRAVTESIFVNHVKQ